jgi:hypothetical protein
LEELARLIRKARQLGLFDGFDETMPEGLKRGRSKPRKRPPMETAEQGRLAFTPSPRTLAELRSVVKQLQEGELPPAKKSEATAAMRRALKAHPTNAAAAINAMRKSLVKIGFSDDKAKQTAITEIRSAVNSLLFQYAKRYAEEKGVRLMKRWKHNDHLVQDPRHNHKRLDGATVPIDEPFTLMGADGVAYHPQHPHDGVLPAGEIINCQCTYDIARVRKGVNRTEVLKSTLHSLAVWKRRVYRIGDTRINPRTGQEEIKRREGHGKDNWEPVAVRGLFDKDETRPRGNKNKKAEKQGRSEEALKEEVKQLELFDGENLDKVEELVEGVKKLEDDESRKTALEAIYERLEEKSADEARGAEESKEKIIAAEDPVEAAEKLPKTPETLEALEAAIDYYKSAGNTALEIYGNDYGGKAFPDNFTDARRKAVAEAVDAYKRDHPDAKLVWNVRGYLVDMNSKPQKTLTLAAEDGKEKKILRSMAQDEERVLDYMISRPNEVKSFFHLVSPAIKRKIFNRFPPADVPELKQRNRMSEIAQKIASGEYDKAGSDMDAARDEKAAAFATPEANEADNKKRLKRLNEKWLADRGVEGGEWEVKGRKGRWRLVEAEAPTASHNEKTFEQTEDFPHNQDGRTMNDRDYRVRTNQENVVEAAKRFDGRALAFDDPIVVSPDGVVLSGNNRTMSSKLAARNGTDAAYVSRLQKMLPQLGFSKGQIDNFKHPRAVFELDGMQEPYSTKLFASFNIDDKKQMDADAAAKKAASILAEKNDVADRIAGVFGKFDNVKKVYDDPDAVSGMMDAFIKSGVIGLADKGRYVSNGGALTENGQTFVENTLLASVATPDDITRLNESGMESVKNAVMRALPRLMKDKTALKDLSGAIDIMRNAIRNKTAAGEKPDEKDMRDAASGGMFEESKPQSQIDMAMKLNGNEADLFRALGGAADEARDFKKGRLKEETAKVNSRRIKPIREKFDKAPKVAGARHSIMLGGEEVRGHWELMDADAPTASHDERTFHSAENFPENDLGRNVNDRDYAKDKDAQTKVIEYAADYNDKALGLDEPVVVSRDGVVLSGNNRTMSSKLAARNGTDAAYIRALKGKARSFGFSQDQLAQFKHPRVVFKPDKEFPYTTDTFAKFNAKEKKGQNEEELSAKAAKIADAKGKEYIGRQVDRAGGLNEFLNDQTAMAMALDRLASDNVIADTEKNAIVDAGGKVSNAGKIFFKNAFLGMSLGENTIHKLYYEGMGDVRSKMQDLSGEIAKASALPKEYDVSGELGETVDILADLNRKRKTYPTIEAYKEKNPNANKLSLYLARKINDGAFEAEDMRRLMKSLKDNSEGGGMFGDQPTKEDVINAFVRKARGRILSRRIVKAWVKAWKVARRAIYAQFMC